MTSVRTRVLLFSAALVAAVVAGHASGAGLTGDPASERVGGSGGAQPPGMSKDPRVGLKPGLKDAGQAAWNLDLVASLPKAPGFFDPAAPAGSPVPPERPAGQPAPAPAPSAAPKPSTPPVRSGLDFANSDIAFLGDRLFLGNFNGINTYDIAAAKPKLIASLVCPGGQGDVSVYKNLLFMSVEQTRGRVDCGTQGVTDTVSKDRFRGVRIFDITDVARPTQVAAVQTCRGSHTHTLLVDPKDKANVYIYGSGTSTVRPGEELSGCSGKTPSEDPNTSLYSIDVIQVPLAAPQNAKLVNSPRIFSNGAGDIAGLTKKSEAAEGRQSQSETNQCHDITVFPEIGLAAGACAGNGILLDISDPVHPTRLDAVADKNFAYWHSATFNNDGTKVVFTDEWGGGTRPRCRATDPPTWGADAIFDIVDRKLQFRGYYKMPAPQTDTENCVAHNGSLIPVPGRDIMAQAWYQGGVSVFDFTDSAHPQEIAFFDRGPIDANNLLVGGYWSAYWYNGKIYGSEIARGLDVFTLKPSPLLSKDEIEAASSVRLDIFNPQEQPKVGWPATASVARAYLDQLERDKAISADRASAVKGAIAMPASAQKVAAELDGDASTASGINARRLHALAETLKGMK